RKQRVGVLPGLRRSHFASRSWPSISSQILMRRSSGLLKKRQAQRWIAGSDTTSLMVRSRKLSDAHLETSSGVGVIARLPCQKKTRRTASAKPILRVQSMFLALNVPIVAPRKSRKKRVVGFCARFIFPHSPHDKVKSEVQCRISVRTP